MQHVEESHWYDAPPERVWAVYTDHAGWKEWSGLPQPFLLRPGVDDPNGAGAVRAFGLGPMKVQEEIVDFEAPKRMTYRVIAGAVPMKNHLGEVFFEPENGGTRITWRCRFDSRVPGLGGAQQRFVQGLFRRALRGLEGHAFPPRAK